MGVHDRFGLPVAQVTFSLKENDKRLLEFGKNKTMDVMRAANPGLTIQALAARTADYLISQNDAVFQSSKRDLAEPPCRHTL